MGLVGKLLLFFAILWSKFCLFQQQDWNLKMSIENVQNCIIEISKKTNIEINLSNLGLDCQPEKKFIFIQYKLLANKYCYVWNVFLYWLLDFRGLRTRVWFSISDWINQTRDLGFFFLGIPIDLFKLFAEENLSIFCRFFLSFFCHYFDIVRIYHYSIVQWFSIDLTRFYEIIIKPLIIDAMKI